MLCQDCFDQMLEETYHLDMQYLDVPVECQEFFETDKISYHLKSYPGGLSHLVLFIVPSEDSEYIPFIVQVDTNFQDRSYTPQAYQ